VAAARARRTVRLKTAKGTRRVRLPRPGPRRPSPGSPVDLLEALAAAVEDRARRFRRRVRCGIPIGRARIDKSVHDLRTSARRLLAALEGLRPFVERKRHRRLRRRIERVLDRSGGLRDVGVELQMLSALGNDEATAALRPLRERLRDKHEALARKLHRQLRRRGARRLRRDIRRVLEGSGRKRSAAAASVRSAAHEAARDGFSRLRKSRLAVSPAELDTIHRMRIDLKEFRYLMEALRPVAGGVSGRELESLHRLQTTMGDLHDLEVLSSTVARHVSRVQPDAATQAAAVLQSLEERHSALLTSFLEAVDPILDSWERILASRRRWTKKPA